MVIPEWESISVVRCTSCSLYYASPMPYWSADDFRVLYSSEYFSETNPWWIEYRLKQVCKRLDLLESVVCCDAAAFLDVGCGHGHALNEAVKRKWMATGLEPSPFLAAQAQQRLGKMATILVESLENNNLPLESYDTIYLDSVLEHLPNPVSAIRTIQRLLKVGGAAYILVPNAEALAHNLTTIYFNLKRRRNVCPRIIPLCRPYHLIGFTIRSFKEIFNKNGLDIIRFNTIRGTEPWRKDVKYGSKNLKGRIFCALECLIWSVGGLLGRGTQIEALVRKK